MLESSKPDIVFGTESWLESNISNSEVFPDNFTVYRKDRPEDPHGGVFIHVSDKIISSEETVLSVEGAELIWVKISVVAMHDLYLCSFYHSPSSHIEYLEKLNESLNRISNTNSTIWLAGTLICLILTGTLIQ